MNELKKNINALKIKSVKIKSGTGSAGVFMFYEKIDTKFEQIENLH